MRWLSIIGICSLLLFASCGKSQAPYSSFLPTPVQIAADHVPTAYGATDYFLYGWDESLGISGILADLVAKGVPIETAWVADSRYPGPCSMVCPTSLMVRLTRPDSRMVTAAFTQDPTRLFCCEPYWLRYDFSSDTR